jgi:2-dehydro-3-deoxygluconokinase
MSKPSPSPPAPREVSMTEHTPVDVLTVGESLGLMVSERTGALRAGATFRLGFGGAESNVAIGVSRLGGRAAWIGRLGGDAVGRLILRELRAEGVEAHAAIDDAPTALMLKERLASQRTRVTYYRRGMAGSRLEPSDISRDVVANSRILHITGITAALSDEARSAVHHTVDLAREAGVLVSFDVNHRGSLWTDSAVAAEEYRRLAARADIVFAGDDEAELVTGEADVDEQIKSLRRLGADHIVIKRGERGAVTVAEDGSRIELAAFPVAVVDTVGAGDAFVAGWLTEFARGADARQRLKTAVACGGFACTVDGDWEAAPTLPELRSFQLTADDPVSR